MEIILSQHYGHADRGEGRLARQEGICVGPVKSLLPFKENHLLRLAFGMQVGDNFQRRSRLHEGDLHVERAEVNAQNGTTRRCDGQEEGCQEMQVLHLDLVAARRMEDVRRGRSSSVQRVKMTVALRFTIQHDRWSEANKKSCGDDEANLRVIFHAQ
jgi:hypothetical protein